MDALADLRECTSRTPSLGTVVNDLSLTLQVLTILNHEQVWRSIARAI
jgi:hypothetical protein